MSALKDQMDPMLCENLQASGIPLISREAARQQAIPTARVVLANMMPGAAMIATETQWGTAYSSEPDVGVEICLAKFDDDNREGLNPDTGEERSRSTILKRYTPQSDVELPIDVLIITGDNLEVEPSPEGLSSRKPIAMDEIRYGKRLERLVRNGAEKAAVTVVSCLASHFVLNYFLELPKQTLEQKAFGVYDHNVLDAGDPFMRGMGNTITAPHSRWGDVSVEQIEQHNQELDEDRHLKVLAASPDIGWLVLRETLPNGNVRIYLQGHPEYDRDDLLTEYRRDRKRGQAIPVNYFPDDDPRQTPRFVWAPQARVLNHNILREARRITAARELTA
jgi:homoserine O-succinyltransferase